ncbi:MAG: type I methionyl aminopeptidase [Patescibacteria group bacterium]
MISLKTKEEIATMRSGARILVRALESARGAVRPGISLRELDTIARTTIVSGGGESAFFEYGKQVGQPGFPATLCASVNDEVVHGIGCPDVVLNEGDIVGLDLGVKYQGLYSDMAVTVGVGTITSESEKLIDVTRAVLDRACALVRPGAHTSDISKEIENYCTANGFSVIRDLSGHGIGYNLHEEPSIFCYYDKRNRDVVLKEGMVICIEPMVVTGDWRVATDDDCWTIRTVDGGYAAHFEHTIAVTPDGYEILTALTSS